MMLMMMGRGASSREIREKLMSKFAAQRQDDGLAAVLSVLAHADKLLGEVGVDLGVLVHEETDRLVQRQRHQVLHLNRQWRRQGNKHGHSTVTARSQHGHSDSTVTARKQARSQHGHSPVTARSQP